MHTEKLLASEASNRCTSRNALVQRRGADIEECTRSALDAAVELEARSIALPAMGTGSAGISARQAARCMCAAIADHLAGETSLDDIRIVLWDDALYPAFQREFRRHSFEE